MIITRRQSLALLGSAFATPLLFRSDEARAARTFRRLGPPVPLGASAPGTQERVRLAAFSDGGLVASWTNFNLGFNTVWCQYFAKNRKPIGTPIEIGNATGLDAGTPLEARPVTFPDGHALIFFTADRTAAGADEGKKLFVQRMSSTRQKVGKPIRVSSETTGRNDIVVAALLTNGNVMVVWQYQGIGTNQDPVDTHCRVVNPNGKPITPERRVTKEGPKGRQTPKSIAALSNGRSVFSYVHFDPVEGIFRVACQRLNSLGQRFGVPLVLKETSSDNPYGAGTVASDLSGRPPVASSDAKAVKGRWFDAVVLKQAGEGKTRVHGTRIGVGGQTIEPLHGISLPIRTQFFSEGYLSLLLEPGVDFDIIVEEREPAAPGAPRTVAAQAADLAPGAPTAGLQTLVSSTGNFLSADDGVITRQNADGTTFALGISDSGSAGVHFWFVVREEIRSH
jgi:hypothetical protein